MGYELPSFLEGVISQDKYVRWLNRKARTHVNRDRKIRPDVSFAEYKSLIHKAVVESEGKDAYTGDPLNWKILSEWDNDKAKHLGVAYKYDFSDLPSVDHVTGRRGPAQFAICSWRTNDAKNDMSVEEFVLLCKKVLKHLDQKNLSI